jgi:hypothetical protein
VVVRQSKHCQPREVDVLVTDMHLLGEIKGIDLARWTPDNLPFAQDYAPRLRPLGDESHIYSKPISKDFLASASANWLENDVGFVALPQKRCSDSGWACVGGVL